MSTESRKPLPYWKLNLILAGLSEVLEPIFDRRLPGEFGLILDSTFASIRASAALVEGFRASVALVEGLELVARAEKDSHAEKHVEERTAA